MDGIGTSDGVTFLDRKYESLTFTITVNDFQRPHILSRKTDRQTDEQVGMANSSNILFGHSQRGGHTILRFAVRYAVGEK